MKRLEFMTKSQEQVVYLKTEDELYDKHIGEAGNRGARNYSMQLYADHVSAFVSQLVDYMTSAS